jgi:lipoyl(octanoyl) transferase
VLFHASIFFLSFHLHHFIVNSAIDAQRSGDTFYDTLLVLEHPSTYTLGRGSKLAHVNFDPFAPNCPHQIHRIERGGEVTWHGKGQVVCYPIFDLTYHKKDLRWYLRQIEGAIIKVLKEFDIQAERDEAGTGVWVDERKIAAIGLSVSKWITMHGLSLNVCPDMSAFGHIVPCGIEHRGVTSLQMELSRRGESGLVDKKLVRDLLIKSIAEEFNLHVSVTSDEPEKSEAELSDEDWLVKHGRKL